MTSRLTERLRRLPRPRRPRGALAILSLGYAGVVVLALVLSRTLGDLWWPATLLTYAPRLVFLAPLGVLALLSGRRPDRGLWWIHGATALLVLGPLMDFHVPFRPIAGPGEARLIAATFNLGGATAADSRRIVAWLQAEGIDLLCAQELSDSALAAELRSELERDWLTLSVPGFDLWARRDRFDSIEEISGLGGGSDWLDARLHDRFEPPEAGWIRLVNVHLPTIRWWANAAMLARFEAMRGEEATRAEAARRLNAHLDGLAERPALVLGDFNMPATSGLWAGLSRWRRAFGEAGLGYDYTIPAAMPWCGIDHILGSLEVTFTSCRVGPDLGSDHRPVVAAFHARY